MNKLHVDAKDRILIVAPHPDDESIGCGGLILTMPNQCSVCVVTDGSRGSKNSSYVEEKRIREEQFKEAMRYAGISDFTMLSYSDGELMNHPDCMKTIDFSKYTKIFLPNGDDNHPDHMAAYIYSLNHISSCDLEVIEVYIYEVHLPIRNITHFFDITNVVEKKREMISLHRDQIENYCYAETAIALNGYRACQANIPYKFYEGYAKVDIYNCGIDVEKVEREKVIEKYKQYFRLLSKWGALLVKRRNGEPIFEKYKWKRVSFLGYTSITKIIIDELENEEIEVVDIIDSIDRDIPGRRCVSPENGDRQIDAMIMVAPYRDYGVENHMKLLGYENIVSIYDVVSEL